MLLLLKQSSLLAHFKTWAASVDFVQRSTASSEVDVVKHLNKCDMSCGEKLHLPVYWQCSSCKHLIMLRNRILVVTGLRVRYLEVPVLI